MLFGLFQIPFMIIAALALALVLDSYLLKRPTVFRFGLLFALRHSRRGGCHDVDVPVQPPAFTAGQCHPH